WAHARDDVLDWNTLMSFRPLLGGNSPDRILGGRSLVLPFVVGAANARRCRRCCKHKGGGPNLCERRFPHPKQQQNPRADQVEASSTSLLHSPAPSPSRDVSKYRRALGARHFRWRFALRRWGFSVSQSGPAAAGARG